MTALSIETVESVEARVILAAFRAGLDTREIADRYEITEAEAHNILGRAQELRYRGKIT